MDQNPPLPPSPPPPPAPPRVPWINPEVAKRKRHWGIPIAFVSVILLLVSGTFYATRAGYLSLPFGPSAGPDGLQGLLNSVLQGGSSETSTNVTIKLENHDGRSSSFMPAATNTDNNSIVDGLASIATLLEAVPANFQLTGSITGYAETPSDGKTGNSRFQAALELAAGTNEYAVEGEFRTIDKQLYVALSRLDGLPNVNDANLVGQWFTTTAEEGLAWLPDQPEVNTNSRPARPELEAALTLAQRHRIFKTTKKIRGEDLNGHATTHTVHAIDPKKITPFLTALIADWKMRGLETSGLEDTLTSVNSAAGATRLETLSKVLTLHFWYDPKASRLRQSEIELILVPPPGSKLQGKQLRLTSTTTITSLNKKITVTAPGAKPFNELAAGLILVNVNSNVNTPVADEPDDPAPTEPSEETEEEVIPDEPDADRDGLADVDEKEYGTDQNNPDTDGDGYKDGEEVENGYNPKGPGLLSDD